jgi:MATE family multidrug resistance protein
LCAKPILIGVGFDAELCHRV